MNAKKLKEFGLRCNFFVTRLRSGNLVCCQVTVDGKLRTQEKRGNRRVLGLFEVTSTCICGYRNEARRAPATLKIR